jgi:arsenate reductase-like glutaredoxin family protein
MSAAEIVLLHNPRCSKSRQAKGILEKAGVDFVERKYLDEPLSKKELVELKTKLGRPVHEWMRPAACTHGKTHCDSWREGRRRSSSRRHQDPTLRGTV